MKQITKMLVACALIIGFSANAQTENSPWSITLGTTAVDFFAAGNDGHINDNGAEARIFDEFFNSDDHWNYGPSLTVGKYLGDGVSISLSAAYAVVNQIGNKKTDKYALTPEVDEEIFNLDFGVNYHFNTLWNGSKFDPYLKVSTGYNWMMDEESLVAGGGLGINYWFNDNLALRFQTMYKSNFAEELDNLSHFQHSLGLVLAFGGTDTDGDGVYDKKDMCPEVAGLKEFNGCPDTDADGIEDAKDACPKVAGTLEHNGCADTDGDGVADPDDACPKVAGLKELAGCPDADADGVIDMKDACPQIAGPAENKGCPWPDTDGDSVLDKDDQCVTVAGTVANNGCPEIDNSIVAKLNDYAKTILFDTGKASFKKQAQEALVAMNKIFNEYPTAKFILEGHADSTGSAKRNQALSEERVNAVKEWFVSNGISADRLAAKGLGETVPVASNMYASGRKQNRRVEIKLAK